MYYIGSNVMNFPLEAQRAIVDGACEGGNGVCMCTKLVLSIRPRDLCP